jgi:hypothetical protein
MAEKKSLKEHEEELPSQQWTLISAMSRLLFCVCDSGLEDGIWDECEFSLPYLREQLHLTNIQLAVLAILIEDGGGLTLREISNILGCPRLSLMVHHPEIEELTTKRWAKHVLLHRQREEKGFKLAKGVVEALSQNRIFVPEKIDGLTQEQFLERLEMHVDEGIESDEDDFCDTEQWMDEIMKANPTLPVSREVMQLSNIHTRSLLLLGICSYIKSGERREDEGLGIQFIDSLYPSDYAADRLRKRLREGTHEVFVSGLMEQKCEDGIVNPDKYVLTREGRERLIPDYTPTVSSTAYSMRRRSVLAYTDIKEKPLFFNADEQEQVDRLAHLLDRTHLTDIQRRLTERGLRKGFACLFYGAPGTGKTETVLQLARQTGRDIVQVDVSKLRDKYVGESEKNVKALFSNYRALCKRSEVTPILFFNEADAIISKRFERMRTSVEQMDNAMQNIILQEMENLDGILIATTNLTANLDSAFERRFLFKVEFHKPEVAVKAQIWQSMIQELNAEEARHLAETYDFSGGQIENIARKRSIEYVLTGKEVTLEELESYCDHELLHASQAQKRVVGFAKA